MPVIANWLQPTNILAALQAGAHAGLSARQADQRDAEMQLRAELEAQQEERIRQDAGARLRENYDALAQARELALRKEAYGEKHDAAKLLQDKTNADALALYRAGILKNQEARINHEKAFQGKGHFNPAGDYFKEVEPGVVKQLFSAPPKPMIDKIPTVTGVPLDPLDPALGKINSLANNPILNHLMGTNASLLGTNYAPMPKITPKSQSSPAPATPAKAEFKKGMRVIQEGRTYEFDGKNWGDIEPDGGARVADSEDQTDEETDDEEA